MKLDVRLASCKDLEEVTSFKNNDERRCQVLKLVEDLRQMVNNPECSDFVFVCKDGGRVHACRMLLVARSPVLRQMLTNGMAESKQTEIMLPEIKSSVLLVILRFLYGGELCDEDLDVSRGSIAAEGGGNMAVTPLHLDWTMLMEVIVAARFLMLDSLEILVLKRLWFDLPTQKFYSEEMLAQTASRLSVVCDYPPLLSVGSKVEGIDFICLRIVQILVSNHLSSDTLGKLSEEAIHYYLVNTHSSQTSDKSWIYSFKEYVRLWQLLTWCRIQTENESTSNGADSEWTWTSLPEPWFAWRMIQPTGTFMAAFKLRDQSESRENLVERIPNRLIKSMLPLVDLTCVHPELLVNVIEPLKIIEHSEFTRVLGIQAIKGSKWLRNNFENQTQISCTWQFPPVDMSENLRVSEETKPWAKSLTVSSIDGFTVDVGFHEETPQLGFTALANAEIAHYGRYQWAIVIIPHGGLLYKTMANAEIGFMGLEYGESMEPVYASTPRKRLSDGSRGWAMRISKDLKYAKFRSCGQQLDPIWNLPPGKEFVWNSRIRFELNRRHNRCLISYAGEKFTLPLDKFYSGLFYPAVDVSMRSEIDPELWRDFNDCDSVSVRIELIRGFNSEPVRDTLDLNR